MATSDSGHVNASPGNTRSRLAEDEAVRGLLLREFDYYADAFWRNEEAGEKRVAVFLSITAALLTIVGFLIGDAQRDDLLAPVAVALAILLLFGRVVFMRLIKRNLDAEGYKEAMAMTRTGRLAWWRCLGVLRGTCVCRQGYDHDVELPRELIELYCQRELSATSTDLVLVSDRQIEQPTVAFRWK